MADNVVNRATADVAAFDRDPKHPEALVGKLEQHRGSPMYLAEVAALLQKQGKWDGFKKHVHDGKLIKAAEKDAGLINEANADSHAHKTDPSGIFTDVIAHLGTDQALYLERYVYDLHTANALKQVDKISDQTVRSRLGIAIGQAEVDGLVSGADIVRSLGTPQPNPGGVGHASDPLTGNAEQVVAQSTRNARTDLDDARRRLQALDDRLQKELREVGPALWDPSETDHTKLAAAQRRVTAYVNDFQGSHEYRGAQARVNACARAVGVEVSAHGADIDAHVGDRFAPGNANDAREVLLKTYDELAANESEASKAAIWAIQHENDQRYASVKGRVVAISRLAQTTSANKAMRDAAASMRGDGGGDERESRVIRAIDAIEKVIKPYHIVGGVLALGELEESLGEVRHKIHTFKSDRSAAAARALGEKLIRALGNKDAILTARIGAGFGMMISIADNASSLTITSNVHAIETAQIFYQRVDAFHKLVAQGAGKSHNAEIAAQAKEVHAAYKTLRGALEGSFGALAIAGGVLGIKEDVAQIREFGADPAVAIKLVGDLASTVGTAIALFPPLAPIGEVVSLAGTLISLIASGFIADKEGNERRTDERERLAKPSMALLGHQHGAKLADTFTTPHAAAELDSAQRHHLTTEQIRTLGTMHPYLFAFSNEFDGADQLLRFLIKNPGEVGKSLKSPYRDSLFEFLAHDHDQNKMSLAIGLAFSNRVADSQAAADLVDKMIANVTAAMPHAFAPA